MLEARNLQLAYDKTVRIRDVNLTIAAGGITAIVGPNASGKSTLLRGLARLLEPRAGSVLLDGRAIEALPARELARRVGVLAQAPMAPDGLTVRDLIEYGRHPHRTMWDRWSERDERAVAGAMVAMRLTDIEHRPLDHLSGGQRQRAWIALALAQDTGILLLDEPTTFLDLANQLDVLKLIGDLTARRARTIVLVLHDLNQAARHADRIVALRDGAVVAQGSPSELIDVQFVRDVFDVEARVIKDSAAQTPVVIPISHLGTTGT